MLADVLKIAWSKMAPSVDLIWQNSRHMQLQGHRREVNAVVGGVSGR